MNKLELIAAVAAKAEISKKDAEKAVKAVTDVIAEELRPAVRYRWLASVLSKFPREQPERAEIPEPVPQ